MGRQPLYGLRMSVTQPGSAPDVQSETFGIRTITTRLIGPAPIAPAGSRQFLVNGVPFVFRAGGWSEDLFLRYSSANTANQIAMIKNLGLNGIRTEGKQMPDDFYEQMDRAGILIDAGYQCCDAWDPQSIGATPTAHEYTVMANSAFTIGQNLRNHPSVMNFSWSDDAPLPEQEAVSLNAFAKADFQDPIIASAEYNSGVLLGPSGEKEGPYDWVPPSYWYDTTHYDPTDPTRTNYGGAWAFDSEASAGATIPTLDSIKRFLSPFEQTMLWQDPDYNQYHLNYEDQLPNQENDGYAFGTLHDLDAAISARYGRWSSLDQYVEEAQVQNYETQRAEFEAYIDHSTNAEAPSTGIVYWQLNKGWPTLLWDLYNYDFDQAGSYFGAKKANEPLHVLYAYDDGTVSVDNLTSATQSGLSVAAKVYNIDGRLLNDQTASGISVPSQGVARELLHPVVPAATTPPARAQTYFVELLLSRNGTVIDRNVYWLSTQHDIVNWAATITNGNDYPQAIMSQYADLTQLRNLRPATVSVTASHPRDQRAGRTAVGPNTETDVTITNTSTTPTVAFFLRADLRRGSPSGVPASGDNEVLPIMWNDNDTTLWPGESETLRATYRQRSARRRCARGQRVRLERPDHGPVRSAIEGTIPSPNSSKDRIRRRSPETGWGLECESGGRSGSDPCRWPLGLRASRVGVHTSDGSQMPADEGAELRDALETAQASRRTGGDRRDEAALERALLTAAATAIDSDPAVVVAAVRLLRAPDDNGATRLEVRDQSMTHRRWFEISDDGEAQWGDR